MELINNGLTGTLPASIDQLQGLGILNFNYNQLQGAVPDLSSPSLFLISLVSNNLSGSIPATYENLPSLIGFGLRNNQCLTATDPDLIAWLDGLDALWNNGCLSSDSGDNCLINGVKVSTAISQPQCDVLLDVYNSTGGDNWINNDQWTTSTDPCTWYGVYCEADKVFALELVSNGLTGTLPASVVQLDGLGVLNLNYNQLQGALPALSAPSLFIISLVSNKFSGNIPASIGDLPSILGLALRNNQCLTTTDPDFKARLDEFDALWDNGCL